MLTYLLAVAAIWLLLLAWIGVQWGYRRFAERNPELGPFRDQDHGCGCCGGGCGGETCVREDAS